MCYQVLGISENGTTEPVPKRYRVRRTVLLVAVVAVVLLAALTAGAYVWGHSAKVMHRCWDGSESEICPPSGVSQGNP